MQFRHVALVLAFFAGYLSYLTHGAPYKFSGAPDLSQNGGPSSDQSGSLADQSSPQDSENWKELRVKLEQKVNNFKSIIMKLKNSMDSCINNDSACLDPLKHELNQVYQEQQAFFAKLKQMRMKWGHQKHGQQEGNGDHDMADDGDDGNGGYQDNDDDQNGNDNSDSQQPSDDDQDDPNAIAPKPRFHGGHGPVVISPGMPAWDNNDNDDDNGDDNGSSQDDPDQDHDNTPVISKPVFAGPQGGVVLSPGMPAWKDQDQSNGDDNTPVISNPVFAGPQGGVVLSPGMPAWKDKNDQGSDQMPN